VSVISVRNGLTISGSLIILMLGICSCAPDTGFNAMEDYDVVVTLHDPQTDFRGLASFAMPDSVVHLKIPDDPVTDQLTAIYDAHILETVRAGFEQRGYVNVNPRTTTPDFFVLVSVTKQDWTEFPYLHHWWVNWSWYQHWPGWSQTWRIEYPAPYSAEHYEFSMGTLFIDVIDVKNADDAGEKIPCRWTAVINGVLGYTSSGVLKRLDADLDQVFAQSSYLGTH
jgi:hypothetical protein